MILMYRYRPLFANWFVVAVVCSILLLVDGHTTTETSGEAAEMNTLEDGADEAFHFVGEDHWYDGEMNGCEGELPTEEQMKNTLWQDGEEPDATDAGLHCFIRQTDGLVFARVELLHRNPPVMRIHRLIGGDLCDTMVHEAEEKGLTGSLVVKDNATDPDDEGEEHESRRANQTWLEHLHSLTYARAYFKTQRIIGFNLEAAEEWQVLSYNPGGHYAPHYDYLDETSPDYWMTQYGNRIATFLLVLQTATKGGGTTFPRLGLTVQPNQGDAIVWFNMEPTGDQSENSLHGACPIKQGRKVAATLWIRTRGQELFIPCPKTGNNFKFPDKPRAVPDI